MKRVIIEYVVIVISLFLTLSLLNTFMCYNSTKVWMFSVPDDLYRYIISVTLVFVYYVVKDKRKRSQSK